MPNKEQRIDANYYKWRKEVISRDCTQCQFPGCSSSKNLEVHHIFRYADNYAFRTNVSNGITLCRTHHKFITGKEDYYASIFLKVVRSKVKKSEETKNNSGHKGETGD